METQAIEYNLFTQAIEHATNEYKKYQQRTLSQVEKDFLDNIKTLPNK